MSCRTNDCKNHKIRKVETGLGSAAHKNIKKLRSENGFRKPLSADLDTDLKDIPFFCSNVSVEGYLEGAVD